MATESIGDLTKRRVREERVRVGLTQQDVAQRLTGLGYPISRQVLAKIESPRDKRAPSLEELVHLAVAMGVEVASLASDGEAPVKLGKVKAPSSVLRALLAGELLPSPTFAEDGKLVSSRNWLGELAGAAHRAKAGLDQRAWGDIVTQMRQLLDGAETTLGRLEQIGQEHFDKEAQA